MNPEVVYRAASEPDEEEAYGAPTKVGPMSSARIAQMMMAAENTERERIHGSTRYSSRIQPRYQPVSVVDVVGDDDEDADLEPTLLNKSAMETMQALQPAVQSAVEPQSHLSPEMDCETTPPLDQERQRVRLDELARLIKVIQIQPPSTHIVEVPKVHPEVPMASPVPPSSVHRHQNQTHQKTQTHPLPVPTAVPGVMRLPPAWALRSAPPSPPSPPPAPARSFTENFLIQTSLLALVFIALALPLLYFLFKP